MQSLLNFQATYHSCFKIWDLKGYLYSKITSHWNYFSGSSDDERKEKLIIVEGLVIIVISTLFSVILT